MSFPFANRPVLVTGGAGFIGSHVADALVARGAQVHVLDDLSGGVRSNVPAEASFHEMDLRDDAVRDLFAEHKFAAVAHLAAQMDVRRSVSDPVFDASVNVLGLLNLLEAGRQHGLEKVVFASTGGAIYGEPHPDVNDAGPQPETHPQLPMSPYGITKLVSEHYLRFYNETYGIDSVALRFANVYGPRQNPHGEAGVVAIFTQMLLRGQQPTINGPGKQTRDYVFVKDVVRAIMGAMEHEGSDIFNVGTGIETDVNQLFGHLNTFTGAEAPEKHGEAKPGEQQRSVLDTSKIHSAFGWSPETDRASGLEETVEWFKQKEAA